MRLSALLASLTILALAFAGCSDGKGDGDGSSTTSTSPTTSWSSSSSTSSSSTSTSSTSTSTGPAPNQAPSGSIGALTNGTNVTFTLNGTDADGDLLNWTLTFGDGNATNGTVLPMTLNHTYGNSSVPLMVNYTLTDGAHNVTYNVTVFGPPNGGTKETFTIEGETTGLDPTADNGIPGFGGCLSADFIAAAGIDGWAWVLTATYHVWFFDGGAALLGDGTDAGTVPAGTTDVAICTADPGNVPTGTFTFVATEP
ncbi:MAG: hypothetical protein WC876_08845 [Candidatus Thermoplasmatota archaeon]|jgi:hypothetical protein